MMIKVIVKATDVPDGSVVTKRTGQQELTLLRSITIYGPDGGKRIVEAGPGVVFLMAQAGKFSAVRDTIEVVWCAPWGEVASAFAEKEHER